MCGCKNQVAGVVDYLGLFSGIGAPQQVYNRIGLFIHTLYYPVGKVFPAFFSVAVSLSSSYRQRIVKKQHSLLCPLGKFTMGTGRYSQIRLQLRVNIFLGTGVWGIPFSRKTPAHELDSAHDTDPVR